MPPNAPPIPAPIVKPVMKVCVAYAPDPNSLLNFLYSLVGGSDSSTF